MPPYDSIAAERLIAMFGIGLGLTIGIVSARGSRVLAFSFRPTRETDSEQPGREFGGEVREGRGRVPWFIWLVLAGYSVWAVAYVVFIGSVGL